MEVCEGDQNGNAGANQPVLGNPRRLPRDEPYKGFLLEQSPGGGGDAPLAERRWSQSSSRKVAGGEERLIPERSRQLVEQRVTQREEGAWPPASQDQELRGRARVG